MPLQRRIFLTMTMLNLDNQYPLKASGKPNFGSYVDEHNSNARLVAGFNMRHLLTEELLYGFGTKLAHFAFPNQSR
jgi:hypothetical protein